MKTLVLLHGWGMRPAVFESLSARLAPRYRVHSMPLAGYDGSPPCDPYELRTLAQSVARAAPERCLVAGWSLGAQVALEWARTVPHQVERLVLIGATPCFAQREDWSPAIEAQVLRDFAVALACDCEGTLKRFVSLLAQGDRESKAVARVLRACLTAQPAVDVCTLQQGLDVLLETDLRGVLQTIGHDVLVIHGEHDALVPPAAGEYLANTLPRARLAVIGGAAHAPFISDVDSVARAMQEFLA